MADGEGDEAREEVGDPAVLALDPIQAESQAIHQGAEQDNSALEHVQHTENQLLNDLELQAQVLTAQIEAQHNPPYHYGQQPVPVPGSLAHAVAVSNAWLWIVKVFDAKLTLTLQGIVCTPLSVEEYVQRMEHYRLMGLIAEEHKKVWFEGAVAKLYQRKKLAEKRQAATYLIKTIASRAGRRYKLAADNWEASGLPKKPITFDDLRGDKRDFQGLNWIEITGLTRAKIRANRLMSYDGWDTDKRPELPHRIEAEERYDEWKKGMVPETADFMKFNRFDFFPWFNSGPEVPKPGHRNALVVGPHNTAFYTHGEDKVWWKDVQRDGHSAPSKYVIELRHPDGIGNDTEQVRINNIAAKHGVLVAGAKLGEFGIRSTLFDLTDEKFLVTGYLRNPKSSKDWRRASITHIDIVKSHTSGLTQAIMSSINGNIYTLDCTTGKQIGEGTNYGPAQVFCTAQSPDNRLRVIVGGGCKVLIAEADEERRIIHDLKGHFDDAVACAWSDNGIHLATAGFDRLVKIWDARMLTHADGSSRTLTTIAAKMSPVRGLEFSPIGSGRRCLMMREEADIISFLDARTFKEEQSIEVFGQLTGGGWSEDGQRVVVGVQDDMVGGMVTVERCGWGQGDEYAKQDVTLPKREKILRSKDWSEDDDEAEGVGEQEQYRTRSSTYWKRKAARAGDFSDLL